MGPGYRREKAHQMKINGERHIPLPRNVVWQALNDPEVLKACIPGCESCDRIAEDEFRIAITAVVGPVKAKFQGKLRLEDVEPPRHYRLVFEGSGGAAGFGKGAAVVDLQEEAGTTVLRYDVEAQVGGKLAQVGARLIEGVARKLSEEFFTRFDQHVVSGRQAAAAGSIAGEPEVPEPPPRTAKEADHAPTASAKWVVLAIGAAAVAAALIYLIAR